MFLKLPVRRGGCTTPEMGDAQGDVCSIAGSTMFAGRQENDFAA
jgi:hypothetical protein